MPPEAIDRLFEPFYRVDAARARALVTANAPGDDPTPSSSGTSQSPLLPGPPAGTAPPPGGPPGESGSGDNVDA